MQVRHYELRSKKGLNDSKLKTPEVTIKKRSEKTSKGTAESKKLAAESSGKNKERDSQTTDKKSQETSSTLHLMLLIKKLQTLYIVRINTLIQPLR